MSKPDKPKVYYRQATDVYREGKSKPTFICSCNNIEMADFIVKCLMAVDCKRFFGEIEDE